MEEEAVEAEVAVALADVAVWLAEVAVAVPVPVAAVVPLLQTQQLYQQSLLQRHRQRQFLLQKPALQWFAGHQRHRRFAQNRWQQKAQHPIAALPFTNGEQAVVTAPQAAGHQPGQR